MSHVLPQVRTFYLAKETPDPRRNEPRNVGIILVQGADLLFRFKDSFESTTTISWVDYWQNVMQKPHLAKLDADPDKIMGHLLNTGSTDHYIEKAGEVILDLRPAPLGNELDRLYGRLVA